MYICHQVSGVAMEVGRRGRRGEGGGPPRVTVGRSDIMSLQDPQNFFFAAGASSYEIVESTFFVVFSSHKSLARGPLKAENAPESVSRPGCARTRWGSLSAPKPLAAIWGLLLRGGGGAGREGRGGRGWEVRRKGTKGSGG